MHGEQAVTQELCGLYGTTTIIKMATPMMIQWARQVGRIEENS